MAFISLSIAILLISSASALSISRPVRSIPVEYGKILRNVSTSITANYGDSVELECYAAEASTPLVWYRRTSSKNNLLPNGQNKYEGNILKLPSVTQKSQGTYICEATDSRSTDSVFYSLFVRSKPLITEISKENMFDSHIELQCFAVCTPKSTFKWYKNGNLLHTETQKEVDNNFSWEQSSDLVVGSLTILTTSSDYKGSYKCEIGNEFGTDEKIFTIDD